MKKDYAELCKEWIRREYNTCIKYDYISIRSAFDRSFGVIMFTLNDLLHYDDEELIKWWDEDMKPKFSIALEKRW